MYNSIYRQTGQGARTRSKLMETIRQQEGLSRNELVTASGLTYDQVRRQVSNLCSDGLIQVRVQNRLRRYYLR